jgi:hypothetical protein
MKMELTREQWLNSAVEVLKPIFTEKGYIVPKVNVSCGFPSTGKDRHIGQCWAKETSEADVNEIFISPKLDDPIEVLDTLVHELVHAVDNCKHSHGAEFKKIALSIGLEGKMRQAAAGEKLKVRLKEMAIALGEYPHKKLKFYTKIRTYKPRPRAVCKDCGYQLNIQKKWLHYGPPLCPVHKTEMEPLGIWDVD